MWIATGAIIYPSQENIVTICISPNSSVGFRSHNTRRSQAIPDSVNIFKTQYQQQLSLTTASTEATASTEV